VIRTPPHGLRKCSGAPTGRRGRTRTPLSRRAHVAGTPGRTRGGLPAASGQAQRFGCTDCPPTSAQPRRLQGRKLEKRSLNPIHTPRMRPGALAASHCPCPPGMGRKTALIATSAFLSPWRWRSVLSDDLTAVRPIPGPAIRATLPAQARAPHILIHRTLGRVVFRGAATVYGGAQPLLLVHLASAEPARAAGAPRGRARRPFPLGQYTSPFSLPARRAPRAAPLAPWPCRAALSSEAAGGGGGGTRGGPSGASFVGQSAALNRAARRRWIRIRRKRNSKS